MSPDVIHGSYKVHRLGACNLLPAKGLVTGLGKGVRSVRIIMTPPIFRSLYKVLIACSLVFGVQIFGPCLDFPCTSRATVSELIMLPKRDSNRRLGTFAFAVPQTGSPLYIASPRPVHLHGSLYTFQGFT